MPVASLVAVPATTTSYNNRSKPTNHYNTKTKSSPKTTSGIGRTPAPKLATNTVATKAGGAYDPFYPNYKGYGRKASSLHSPASPAVRLEETRPYFPNYFPKE